MLQHDMTPKCQLIGGLNRPNQDLTGDDIEIVHQVLSICRRSTVRTPTTSPPGVAKRARRRDLDSDHHRGLGSRSRCRWSGHHHLYLRPDQQDQLIKQGEANQRTEGERGEVTTAVLAIPIAMLIILLIVQAALVSHAQAIVDAAAQDGAQAGQGASGNEDVARAAAQSTIGTYAENLLSNVHISSHTSRSQLSVTVEATVKSLIPGYRPTISSTAAGSREVFIPVNQR